MVLPTLALVAAMGAGVVADVGTAVVLEHVLMLGGMLARPEEHSRHAH